MELGKARIDEFYVHGPDMIYPFDSDNGKIEGFVTFASDVLGNYFAFNPNSENTNQIYYCSHDPLGFSTVAASRDELLKLFIESSFDIVSVTKTLDLDDI